MPSVIQCLRVSALKTPVSRHRRSRVLILFDAIEEKALESVARQIRTNLALMRLWCFQI